MTTLTDEQRSNLDKLATYLEGLPEDYSHFDMGLYNNGAPRSDFAFRPRTTLKQYGAVACVIGHGPVAGIRPIKSDKVAWGDVSWRRYGVRCFSPEGAIWRFLFAGHWASFDNHHHGAAKRIRWILAGNPPLEVGDLSYQQVPA